MTKKLVVFVDTQGDFIFKGFKLPVPGAEDTLPALLRYAASLDPEEIEAVVKTFDTHTEKEYIGSPENLGDPENGQPGFDIHCERGTPGWENVINPRMINGAIPQYDLLKDVFGMWVKDDVKITTSLGFEQARDEFFEELKARGVDTVIIAGYAADFCVKWAIEGFVARGFTVEVPRDLTKGIVRDIDQTVAEDFAGQNVTVFTAFPEVEA